MRCKVNYQGLFPSWGIIITVCSGQVVYHFLSDYIFLIKTIFVGPGFDSEV